MTANQNSQQHTYIAIMAGGVGSRFWPASREAKPKQFLDIAGNGKSLLRLTFERFLRLVPASHIFVVTNEGYRALVKEHLPELSDGQILGEPSRNNTAPCVAYTAMKLFQLDEQANLVIAPSDHLIHNEDIFLDNIRHCLDFTASREALLTLGIAPTHPHTGYGYIEYGEQSDSPGIYAVKRFAEKPPVEQAKAYLASGNYLWNAGIFIWRAATILEAFRRYAADIYDQLSPGLPVMNSAEEQAFINAHYPATRSISIDYAIMEQADNVFTLPAQFGWSDLGAWASLHEEVDKDANGNALQGDQILAYDTHNCLIRAPKGKMVVAGGLDDFIIVDEGDVLLIFPKNREQEIKKVGALVREQFGADRL